MEPWQIRGEFMKVAAAIENNGIPLDAPNVLKIQRHFHWLILNLIAQLDNHLGVFDGTTFKLGRWLEWCERNEVTWPRTGTGQSSLSDDDFKKMEHLHPLIGRVRELRKLIRQIDLENLVLYSDGRSRCLTGAFGTLTGRNNTSDGWIFGKAHTLHPLVKPQEGTGVVMIDMEQAEFGIAAALSGDANMLKAYTSGDPYLQFAKMANAVPADATKQTHRTERDLYKICALGVQYSMGPDSLAVLMSLPHCYGEQLLARHKRIFSRYWEWSDSVVRTGGLRKKIQTGLGWSLRSDLTEIGERTLRNFLLQAHCADIMRLSAILIHARGVKLCSLVHDAFLVEAPVEKIDEHVRIACRAISEAASFILKGLSLRTEVNQFHYPDRYMPDKGKELWTMLESFLKGLPDA